MHVFSIGKGVNVYYVCGSSILDSDDIFNFSFNSFLYK